MGKHFKYLFFSFIILNVQTYLSPLISIKQISPDLLLIWIVYIALKEGQFTGIIWGFVIGLMFDLSGGLFIGLAAMTKTIAGFLAGYFHGENKAPLTLGSYRFVLIILLVSLVHSVIYFVLFTRGSDIGFWKAIFQYGVATSFYTSAVSLLPMFIFGRKYLT
ncbi:MAG: rod shape-determining protein MreD [Ignavibacteriales bacterium]|nr:rod shape-determining protein MreD [Ignavibacteriales bacterium]